jgi:hypothetical protein
MKIIKIFFSVLLIISQIVINAQALNNGQNFIVRSDPRVELLSIVFMMAGASEYSQSNLPAYKNDAAKYFENYKEHEIIKLAREYRDKYGVSYDAVMSMAVHLKNAITLEVNTPFSQNPEKLDKRWKPENAEKFVETLRNFVVKTDFQKFIYDHTEFYKQADQRLTELIGNHAKLNWYESFFGRRASGQFILVPGYLTGGGNYGVGFKDTKNGIDEMYSVTSIPKVDEKGIPVFNPQIVPTVIHEFCHSYVNPVVEKHISELKNAGETIFPFVSAKMSEQAYGQWSTMMIESVVRACVNRYLAKNSNEEAVKNDIRHNIDRGFIWMDDLVKLFDAYENNRKEYSSLDEFFPNIVRFFNGYSKIIKDKISTLERENELKLIEMKEKGPKIVSTFPVNGNNDVDCNIEDMIITFDTEMKDLSWAFLVGKKAFPTVVGHPAYDMGKKVLKLKIKLKPNTEYEMWLNNESNLGFRSSINIPLAPVLLKFKTK